MTAPSALTAQEARVMLRDAMQSNRAGLVQLRAETQTWLQRQLTAGVRRRAIADTRRLLGQLDRAIAFVDSKVAELSAELLAGQPTETDAHRGA